MLSSLMNHATAIGGSLLGGTGLILLIFREGIQEWFTERRLRIQINANKVSPEMTRPQGDHWFGELLSILRQDVNDQKAQGQHNGELLERIAKAIERLADSSKNQFLKLDQIHDDMTYLKARINGHA